MSDPKRPKSTGDPLAPLTRRLTELTRDSSNTIANALTLFTGIRNQARPRQAVRQEIFRLKAQLVRVESAFLELDEILEALESHAGELNENELIGLVDRIATAGIVSQQTATVMALDYVNTATRLLGTRPGKFIEVIREIDSHEGGREQIEAFCQAVRDYYGPEAGQ